MKTNSIGVRLEPALLDRLDVVAARWSAASPIPIEYDRSTIVRGLMQRALLLVEAELGITPTMAPAPADVPAARPPPTPAPRKATDAKPAADRRRGRSKMVKRGKTAKGSR